jgi:hypothetical protein
VNQYRRPTIVAVLVALVAAACDGGGADRAAPVAYPRDNRLRVDEIQLLTTHNSYHQRPSVPLPGAIGDELDYEHLPLDEQLDLGVRGFELDLVNNGNDFPVVHIPVVDAASNCSPFRDCLEVIKRWSDDQPGHAPIFVLLETKEGNLERALDPRLRPFDRAAYDRVDEDIRSVFKPRDLLTPDDVRGNKRTLRAAVRDRGWPTLAEARGKVVFVLNKSGGGRDTYLEGRPALEGAAMFVTAEPDAPSAAVIKVDDPDERLIEELVRDHFIVRTRADANTAEARVNDTARRDLALRSGAQIVSTDYPVPDPTINADYFVELPGGKPGRCNPVQAPKRCRSVDVENPRFLTSLQRRGD